MHKFKLKIVKELIIDEYSFSDEIIFFYLLHSKFNKPIIYNYNSVILSKGTLIPENKVRKYINFLIREGIIIKSGKNLILKSITSVCKLKEITKYRKLNLDTYKSLSFKDFKIYLFSFLIKYNQIQQQFAIDALNPTFKTECRAFKKYRRETVKRFEGKDDNIVNSIRGLARFFNRSNTFIYYWLKKSKDKNVLDISLKLERFKIKTFFKSIKQRNSCLIQYFKTNSLFYRYINGQFYIVKGSIITFKTEFS